MTELGDRNDVELGRAWAAVRAIWWLPVLTATIGAGVGLGLSLAQTPMYTSSTQLFVSTTGSTSASDAFQGGQFSQQRVASYARLLTGQDLAGRVIEELDLDVSAADLRDRISASAITDTVLIDVSVEDSSPARAQLIARALGSEFADMVADLEAVGQSGDAPVRVTVTDQPDLPSAPSSPVTSLNLGLGLLVGLLGGIGASVARAKFDNTVRDAEEAARLGGAPIVGSVLRDAEAARNHVVVGAGDGRAAEGYRQLRTNLRFLKVDDPPKVVMVTSAVPAEGKTTLVLNLALALISAGQQVLVIDADLRRPKVARYLGLVGGVGLTNVLSGSAREDEVVQTYGSAGLNVVAAGPTPPNPGDLLSSSQMSELVKRVRKSYDVVLVDAPPLLPVADASGLAGFMDGILISVRYGTTTRDQLEQAAEALTRVGTKALGVVLNMVPQQADIASAYGYSYGAVDEYRGPNRAGS